MNVVLYSDNIEILQKWDNALSHDCHIIYEYEQLYNLKETIIVINDTAFEGDIREGIKKLKKNLNKILIIHHNPTLKNAKELLKLGAKGYGCISMKEHFLVSAVETIKDGMVWLHSEFTSMLLSDNSTKSNKEKEILQNLTTRESEVFLLLKDGSTYKDIANKLSITPRTVKAHAQSIYLKLNIKDRFGLINLY